MKQPGGRGIARDYTPPDVLVVQRQGMAAAGVRPDGLGAAMMPQGAKEVYLFSGGLPV